MKVPMTDLTLINVFNGEMERWHRDGPAGGDSSKDSVVAGRLVNEWRLRMSKKPARYLEAVERFVNGKELYELVMRRRGI